MPVEIRLFDGEVMQVPLAVAHRLPGRATEDGGPVRRGQLALLTQAVTEDIAVTGRRPRGGLQGLLEPNMQVGGMVGHHINNELQACCMQGAHHLIEVSQGTDLGVNIAEVIDIVAAVSQG